MRMIGKTYAPPCGSKCCGPLSTDKAKKRQMKRRERQAWKKEVR